MVQNPASISEGRKKRSLKDLFIWLALIPLILITLLCCGQLAMYSITAPQGDNTSSLLSADYHPWAYDQIPAVNVQAFLNDVNQEQVLNGTPTLVILPTTPRPIPTSGITLAPTPTVLITITQIITPTKLFTITPTKVIITPSPTATFTPPPPPITVTPTLEPPPPITRTPTPTPGSQPTTQTPTPTGTYTVTPTFTSTVTPTSTPTSTNTPTTTVTYSPLWPLLENSSTALNGGCHAYFGYRNDNTNEVDIQVGPLNNLNDPSADTNPPQPTHFLVGRQYAVFEFTWYSGAPLIWSLDGRAATADWCYP